MDIEKLEKNVKNGRYNYKFTKNVGSCEMAKLLEAEIRKGPCMAFTNGMGYVLSVEGSALVMRTNRCQCSPSVEMTVEESDAIQEVFTSRVRNALYSIYERTNGIVKE